MNDGIRFGVFAAFALLTLGSAFVVAFATRIVHSLFALLFTFFGVAGLYAILSADFLAGAQLLVYVGGILVLLLFGLMLTHKIQAVTIASATLQRRRAAAVCVLLLAILLFAVYRTPWPVQEQEIANSTEGIGRHLMTDYLLPFELISVLLLGVLVAAATMARKEAKR